MSAESTSAAQVSLNTALEETLEEVLLLTNLVTALGDISELSAITLDPVLLDLH